MRARLVRPVRPGMGGIGMNRSQSWVVVAVRTAGFAAGLFLSLTASMAWAQPPRKATAFRPPAVPLVASDPYLSIWSMADRLTDDTTRHWTRREHPLVSLIRIDGKAYRLMGTEPKNVPAMKQVGVQVLPTRTIYDFDDGHVHVTLTFLTPALPDDLDVLARPLTYLTWDVRSVDGAAHVVSIYDSTSALLAVNTPDQKVEWAREHDRRPEGAPGRDGRPDAAAAGRRRHAHRLGLRLCRRAGGAGPGGDRARAARCSSASSSRATLPDRRRRPNAPRRQRSVSPCLAFAFDLGACRCRSPSRGTS